MRIFHITAMNPLNPNSGIPAVLQNLTKHQNAIDGIEASVISLRSDVSGFDSNYFYNISTKEIKKFILNHKPDVAIFHSFFHYEYAAVAKIFISENIPFYIEPHGSFGNNAMKKGRIKKRIANATVFGNQIKKAYGYIFTNLQEQKDSIYRTQNDLVIPNGVDKSIVYNVMGKDAKNFKEPVFYYLGRYDVHHKGLDYLFNALDILDNKKVKMTINFYGIGNTEQLKYINYRISCLSNICAKQLGAVHGHAKEIALGKSNIQIMTSRYEGSPMAILDGLSYGNPCLVTPGTNVSQEILDNGLGWSCKLDAQEIAEMILIAIKDYKKQGEMYYDKCKRYVAEKYTWEKIAISSIEKLKKSVNNLGGQNEN